MNIESAIINCERGHPLSVEDCLEVLFRLQAAESKLEEMNKVEPVAYGIYSDTGHIRIWWLKRNADEGVELEHAKEWARSNGIGFDDLTPVFLHPQVQSNADKENIAEIIKAVAHIGVDFGYGEYQVEQHIIDLARKIHTELVAQ